MFSQTVEYALRASLLLARADSRPQTTEQLAGETQVPCAYLSKVLQSLRRAGIVRSRRGIGGGIVLASPPEQITILDVVNAVEPLRRIESCPLNLEEHRTQLCSLHRRIDQAIASIEQAFRQTTLRDLLSEAPLEPPLCGAEPAPIRPTTIGRRPDR